MAAELGESFSLTKSLQIGLVPLIERSPDPQETLSSYAALYLKEEVQMEGLVAQHLRAWIAYSTKTCNLFYWRTKPGNEVDFVLYGQDTFWAIEVKNSAKINSKMLKGLTAFQEDYPEAQTLLLYRGDERLSINNTLCLPCEKFLRSLIPGQILKP